MLEIETATMYLHCHNLTLLNTPDEIKKLFSSKQSHQKFFSKFCDNFKSYLVRFFDTLPQKSGVPPTNNKFSPDQALSCDFWSP